MKTINELNSAQLNYLRQKWASEIIELDRDITRSQNRLDTRLGRQSVDSAHLAQLKTGLDNARKLLQHLKNTSAAADMIEAQQQAVNTLQSQYDDESMGQNVLTDEEAQLQQTAIDELKLRKSYRETKLSAIDSLLPAQAAA